MNTQRKKMRKNDMYIKYNELMSVAHEAFFVFCFTDVGLRQ